MIEIEVPGRGTYCLAHVVLDVNGTIVVGGELVAGVARRVTELRRGVQVYTLTADTRGRQDAIDDLLGFEATRIMPGDEAKNKADFVRALVESGAGDVCAIGNGANDAGILQQATLGIAVLGEEGLAVETLLAADTLVPHVNVALDILLDPPRLVATLRR